MAERRYTLVLYGALALAAFATYGAYKLVESMRDANEVPTPTLVTESGRALTAHHSVLIVPVLGAHAKDDPNQDPYSQAHKRRTLGVDKLPTNQGVLVGSYASVARMLDELAAVPGVQGVMLTFDDFVIGMEQFGTRILPLMRCRNEIRAAA